MCVHVYVYGTVTGPGYAALTRSVHITYLFFFDGSMVRTKKAAMQAAEEEKLNSYRNMWRSQRTREKSRRKQIAITQRGGQRRMQEHANDSGGAEGEGGEGTEGNHNTPASNDAVDGSGGGGGGGGGPHNDGGFVDPREPKVFSREHSVNGKEISDHAFVLMFCENWGSTQARKLLWKKTRTTSTLLVIVAVVSVMTQVSASTALCI